MRPFGTSLGHFYSYGTQVGMSILFHLIGRHEQIMPSSDQARSTVRPCRHMQLTNTCRGRILRKDQTTKHACTLRTTSMRSAQSWATSCRQQRLHGGARKSMLRCLETQTAAAHAHRTQLIDDLQRVEVLPTMPLADELVQPPFAIQPADGLNCTRWRACQLQQRSSGVF
mgnify:CR=1 FL=1